jgi:hypothetical protein
MYRMDFGSDETTSIRFPIRDTNNNRRKKKSKYQRKNKKITDKYQVGTMAQIITNNWIDIKVEPSVLESSESGAKGLGRELSL